MRVKVRGVSYHIEVDGSGPPVVMLHGFTGSTRTWDATVGVISRRFRTIRVDLLGHGQSDAPEDPSRYAMTESAEDLISIADELQLDRFHLVGYSMGGRLALHLAIRAPHRLRSLVLESASAGIFDPEEQRLRRESDARLADFVMSEGITAFVDRWEKVPLFETEQRLPIEVRQAIRTERLSQRPIGLANSLRGAGAGSQQYLLDQATSLQVPILVVAGLLDAKYKALAELLGETVPHARVSIVPGAGHAVHRERPEEFSQIITRFLQDVEGIE